MSEEKSHKHGEPHSHEKKDEKYKFEISKVRIWQLISVILVIAIVFLWFNQGSDSAGAAPVNVPSGAQPSPGATQQQPTKQEKQDIDVDDDPFLGPKDAKVVVVEFSDFECPYCGAAMGTHEELVQRFKSQDPDWEAAVPKMKELAKQGKIKFVYRDFPLSFHPQAKSAAEASECADEQGKFWVYHDALFENQDMLSNELYLELAEQLGLDVNKFKTCVETGKYGQEVQADVSYGAKVGVSGTPTFFVNGVKVTGAQPYSVFKQIIDAELSKK
jgi:protein-disulfide isomerase